MSIVHNRREIGIHRVCSGNKLDRGYFKCNNNKVFPGGFRERNYSGFDVEDWEQRTNHEQIV